ncbi:jg18664 [Pararge aegeria aegeria]|uniref:Jg18664 protein n=1 Tax=Pararge aegeria aegeria TaxID=348720 RepID=A0A8S4RWH8_9NEOP|nr:jg18664 [Pararge aegeria aegeria]
MVFTLTTIKWRKSQIDPRLLLMLAVNSSAYVLGAVLSQVHPDGSERIMCYASRTLSDAERRYSQIDKEALAILDSPGAARAGVPRVPASPRCAAARAGDAISVDARSNVPTVRAAVAIGAELDQRRAPGVAQCVQAAQRRQATHAGGGLRLGRFSIDKKLFENRRQMEKGQSSGTNGLSHVQGNDE